MGFLNLIKQHDRERAPAHGLRQLSAFFVADVPRGRAHQPADGMALAVLGHIDADKGVLVAEEELRQRSGQFGLSHARGPQEDE